MNQQLLLFGDYDTKWLIKQATEFQSESEAEILEKTGRIGKMPLGHTTEEELIRIFRMYYNKRHSPRFGHYTQHPRNCARSALWRLRYYRYFLKEN